MQPIRAQADSVLTTISTVNVSSLEPSGSLNVARPEIPLYNLDSGDLQNIEYKAWSRPRHVFLSFCFFLFVCDKGPSLKVWPVLSEYPVRRQEAARLPLRSNGDPFQESTMGVVSQIEQSQPGGGLVDVSDIRCVLHSWLSVKARNLDGPAGGCLWIILWSDP